MAQEIENLGRIENIRSFSDAPTPKFTKLTNFTKKTIREIATSLSAIAMTIHKLL